MKDRSERYTKLIERCPNFERKGKKMAYTSANGHMFSQLNKLGELGIRFSKEDQETYFHKFNTTIFKSYGAIMKGYILDTEEMWQDEDLLIQLLNQSYRYVMSLPPKVQK